jgi:hypothetical protein
MSTHEYTKKTKSNPDDQMNDPKLQNNNYGEKNDERAFVPNDSHTSGIPSNQLDNKPVDNDRFLNKEFKK